MEESKKSTRRFLVIYCIAIFAFAVALILIASFSQMRINREADAIQERLTNAEILAADKNTKLDAAMTENQRLTDQIKALESEKESITAQNEEALKKLEAYKAFINIVNLDRIRSKNELKTAIDAFEAAQYPSLLSPDELKIYEAIK